ETLFMESDPSRAECTICHNMAAKYALGINTLQMNHEFDYGKVRANQLDVFAQLGLFNNALPQRPEELPHLVDYRDDSHDTVERARSYLHANCSHCHRKWGGGNAEFRLLSSIEQSAMGIVDVPVAHGGFFIPDVRIVASGVPQRSVMYYRMAKLGPGRMPRLGSSVVDEAGLKLIREWIAGLSESPSDIEQLVPQQTSLMPDLLLRDLTPQQVADLLAYLVELQGAP
ncbi:MAG: hypothetical protein AB7U20_24550, partial [Planctomycetaceae bacterium]